MFDYHLKVFYKPALPPPPKLAPGEIPSASSIPPPPSPPVEEFEVPFGLCVWAAGTAARPITRIIATQAGAVQMQSVNVTGRLLVDQWLRVQGMIDGRQTEGCCLFRLFV